MKILLLITTLLFTTLLQAKDTYVGAKIGYSQYSNLKDSFYNSDFNWALDDGAIYGLMISLPVTKNLSFDVEYITSETQTKDIEINDCSSGFCIPSKADIDSDIYNSYITYKTSGKIYFLGRLGITYQEHEMSGPHFNSKFKTVYETGPAASIGAGYNMGKINIELEYNRTSESFGYIGSNLIYRF